MSESELAVERQWDGEVQTAITDIRRFPDLMSCESWVRGSHLYFFQFLSWFLCGPSLILFESIIPALLMSHCDYGMFPDISMLYIHGISTGLFVVLIIGGVPVQIVLGGQVGGLVNSVLLWWVCAAALWRSYAYFPMCALY